MFAKLPVLKNKSVYWKNEIKINPEGKKIINYNIRLIYVIKFSIIIYIYIINMNNTAILNNYELYITAERFILNP